MIIDYKVEAKSDFSDWRIIFQYDSITFGLVLSYHALVFVRFFHARHFLAPD
jgi:hypothetical protein